MKEFFKPTLIKNLLFFFVFFIAGSRFYLNIADVTSYGFPFVYIEKGDMPCPPNETSEWCAAYHGWDWNFGNLAIDIVFIYLLICSLISSVHAFRDRRFKFGFLFTLAFLILLVIGLSFINR